MCQSVVATRVFKSWSHAAFYKANGNNIMEFKEVLQHELEIIQSLSDHPTAHEIDNYYHCLVNVCT